MISEEFGKNCRKNADKLAFNLAIREVKAALKTDNQKSIQNFLHNLDNNQASDYSLRKATKKIKKPTNVYATDSNQQ